MNWRVELTELRKNDPWWLRKGKNHLHLIQGIVH